MGRHQIVESLFTEHDVVTRFAYVEDEERWIVSVRVSPSGAVRWLEVAPEPGEPEGVMTGRMLRRLPLAEYRTAAMEQAADLADNNPHLAASTGSPSSDHLAAFVTTWREGSRPGSRGRPDREYAVMAKAYVDRLGSGTEIKDLAAELNLSRSTVKNLIWEARNRRGLLTKAPRGRAGGELTEKAKRILEGED